MYRGRYWGFANDFFAQFSKDCRPAQEFVLLIVEKHNGFSLNSLCGILMKNGKTKKTLFTYPHEHQQGIVILSAVSRLFVPNM